MAKKKILIVDDEQIFCKALSKFLAKKGYDSLVAYEGQRALEQIQKEKPDLITLDIRMPGINGYEVLTQVKVLEKAPKIVVVSAIDRPNMEEYLERAGADAVLHKPVDLDELVRVIQKLIGSEDVSLELGNG